jgi:Tol biopolymer transport system component
VNRRIFIVLGSIIILGLFSLYALQQGPVLLLGAPKEERIAFVSDRGGQTDIWTMLTDGSDVRQVTNDSADDQIPAWSPDGKELVAISDRRDRVYQVFLSAWDGRYTHDLSSSQGTKDSPVWSKDNREVTFITGGKVYGITRSGGQEEQYLPAPGMSVGETPGRSNFVYGAWSPDGQILLCAQETDQGRFAFTATRDDIEAWDGGELKTTPIVVAHGASVVWAPSGHKVAASFVDRAGKNGIFVGDLDAVAGKDLFTFSGDTMAPGKLAWSPDGKTLVFEMWTVQDGMLNRPVGIYTVSASGGKPRVIVKGDAREPCWSADGKQIVYTGITGKERRDIWRVNADGAGVVNLTKGKGDSYNPSWSPLSIKK